MTETGSPAAQPRGLSSVATFAGWILTILSLIILTGWAFNLQGLERFVPQSAETKANSAVAILLAAFALLRRDHRDRSVYSILMVLIGALTLGEYFYDTNFGIDQVLVRDTHYFRFPGRMSQYASLGFMGAGISLFLMRSRSLVLRELSRALAAATGTLGLIVLVSHFLATPSLNLIGPHRNVAVPTALAYILAAIGVQYANPGEGLVRLVHADNPGGTMLRRLFPAAFVCTLALAVAVGVAQRHYHWENGFSLTLAGVVVASCLVTVIVITAIALQREHIALRESEQRFGLAANSAPVMIWMSRTDKLCTYFNEPWLRFTGRPLQAELGNGWIEGIHPEDLGDFMSVCMNAFDRRDPFHMQYRLRRHDGEYRWIFDTGVPRFSDGVFAGYIGSCIDITDRKVAEEALADLERRVLNAQEEERSRIARELHDDINQRIAVLTMELGMAFKRNGRAAESELHASVDAAIHQLRTLANDIQGISRRLHASHLEYLGLPAAAGSLCRELAAQQQVEIDFRCDPVLPPLPKNVSLSLYRVLQEALQNAIKHSGVRAFKVELAGTETEIRLSISDEGAGLDPKTAGKGVGLGLISMRERMRLARGEFSVESLPGHGTTIRCRVTIEAGAPTSPLDRDTQTV